MNLVENLTAIHRPFGSKAYTVSCLVKSINSPELEGLIVVRRFNDACIILRVTLLNIISVERLLHVHIVRVVIRAKAEVARLST